MLYDIRTFGVLYPEVVLVLVLEYIELKACNDIVYHSP